MAQSLLRAKGENVKADSVGPYSFSAEPKAGRVTVPAKLLNKMLDALDSPDHGGPKPPATTPASGGPAVGARQAQHERIQARMTRDGSSYLDAAQAVGLEMGPEWVTR
jgi:hypothetical protein